MAKAADAKSGSARTLAGSMTCDAAYFPSGPAVNCTAVSIKGREGKAVYFPQ